MPDNHHFNPNLSEVNPKENISPKFEVIAWDIKKWASCHIRMATTEVRYY
jgi:hypothetical protein